MFRSTKSLSTYANLALVCRIFQIMIKNEISQVLFYITETAHE